MSRGLGDVYKRQEYIQTAQAQGILQQYGETLFGNIGDITLTWDQINGLASELASGYQQYASANRLPDPGKMGDHFLTYLGTEDGQQRITAGLETMVDMAGLQEQIKQKLPVARDLGDSENLLELGPVSYTHLTLPTILLV